MSMSDGSNSFTNDPYDAWRNYSLSPQGGVDLGNPALNIAASMLLGQGLFPRPLQGSNQSIMDAKLWRDTRNRQFFRAAQQGLANNVLGQKLAINPNSTTFQMLSPFLMDPEGIVARTLSPFIGGNPIKAQMGLFADLSGQTMSSFGRMSDIGLDETNDIFNTMQNHFILRKQFKAKDYISNAQRMSKSAGVGSFFAGINTEGSADDLSSALTSKFESDLGAGRISVGKQLQGPEAQRELIKAFSDAIRNGDKVAGMDKYGGDVKELAQISNRIYELTRMGGVPSGLNLSASRGFGIDDFTGAFGKAASFRLLGKQNGDIQGAADKFSKYAPEVLDAARGIFGNDKSGAELQSALSELYGTGTFNLTDKGSTEKLSNLLREVKAAARVAGVSIDTIKGIIEQGRQLTIASTGMDVGGEALMQGAIGITSSVAATLGTMSPEALRRASGPMGMMNDATTGLFVRSVSDPISQKLAAMHTFFGGRGDKEAQAEIIKYAQSTGNLGEAGLADLVQRLTNKSGANLGELVRFTTDNQLASNKGFIDAPELMQAGNNQLIFQAKTSYINQIKQSRNITGVEAEKLLTAAVDSHEVTDVTELEEKFGIKLGDPLSQRLSKTPNIFLKFGSRKYQEQIDRMIKISAGVEKAIAKDFGYINAPILTGIFSKVGTGEIKTLKEVFASLTVDNNLPSAALSGVGNEMTDIFDIAKGNPITGLPAKDLAALVKLGGSADDVRKKTPLQIDKLDAYFKKAGLSGVYHGDLDEKSIRDYLIEGKSKLLLNKFNDLKSQEYDIQFGKENNLDPRIHQLEKEGKINISDLKKAGLLHTGDSGELSINFAELHKQQIKASDDKESKDAAVSEGGKAFFTRNKPFIDAFTQEAGLSAQFRAGLEEQKKSGDGKTPEEMFNEIKKLFDTVVSEIKTAGVNIKEAAQA